MNTIFVPTDFSETSKNAIHYAANLANDIGYSKFILYHAYEGPVYKPETGPVFEILRSNQETYRRELDGLALELKNRYQVEATCLLEEGNLLDNLEKIYHHHPFDIVVMGITGASRLGQMLIGSTTLHLINRQVCPVLIVPPDATYKKIQTIVFASDFKDVNATTPTAVLRKWLSDFKANLHVVNVDAEHFVEISEEYKKEKAAMDIILGGFQPQYSFIRLFDFTEAMHLFAQDKKADLIITLPRRHGFLADMFGDSHTKMLAYHSHIPILALHG